MVASPPSKAIAPAPVATPPVATPPVTTPPMGHGVPPPQFRPQFLHQENPNRPPSLPHLSPISNVNTARTAQSPWSAPSSTSPRALTLSMAKDALGEDSKETRERLAGLNSRRDAMNEVRVYLKEAWEMMGPSFLETVAATEKKNDDGACMEDVAMHYENQEPLEESVDVN
ncbi:hypothetical protein glysoja_045012 [Glycine soja]|uniref:Uncharacterized protein n=1 Tax=Glycine soja TaxID=3848 RepID=A0A0B2Q414_GLYSO|nr:hypothetical protein glysoja_045012 [Glycine soja]